MRLFCVAAVLPFLAFPCLGEQKEFDVASVKLIDPSHPRKMPMGGPGSNEPGHYSARVWFIDLLKAAYGLPEDQILGGLAWMRGGPEANLYEVDATMPKDTSKQRFQMMLQNLLLQRFHLFVHRAMEKFPAFDLVIAKGGPKLKEVKAAVTGKAGAGGDESSSVPRRLATDPEGFPILPDGPHTGQILSKGNLKLKFQDRSISYLADILGALIYNAKGPAFGPKMPRVSDKTGMIGTYDFTLEFACGGCVAASPIAGTPEAANGTLAGTEGPDIFGAIEKQLGLRAVRTADIPIEVLVVDRADKVPSAN